MTRDSAIDQAIGKRDLRDVESRLIRLIRVEQQAKTIARDMTEVNQRLTDRNSSAALTLKNFQELLARQQFHFNSEIAEAKISTSLFRVNARHVTGLHESLRNRDLPDRRVLHIHEMKRLADMTRVDLTRVDQELPKEFHAHYFDSKAVSNHSCRTFSMRDSMRSTSKGLPRT